MAIPAYLPRQRVSSIPNCKKAEPKPAFPAKSITRSNELSPLSQGYLSSSGANKSPIQLDQFRHDTCPSGLVARADVCAIVSKEILEEQ
jgi:hypothetical protein